MRAQYAVVISLVVMLAAAVLIAPASGQDAPPPEATPETTPEATPAAYPADPDAISLVFEAPRRCIVTSGDSAVAIRGVGVYDLETGAQRFDFDGHNGPVRVSYRHPRLLVAGKGLYDIDTGELLVESTSPNDYLSPVTDFLAIGAAVYDIETGAVIFEAGEDVVHSSADRLHPDSRWVWISYQPEQPTGAARLVNFIIDLETNAPPAEPFAFMSRLLDRMWAIAGNGSLVAISGDGVYDLETGDKRFELGEMRDLRFSNDAGILLAMTTDDELQLIDTQSGDVILRREDAAWVYSFGYSGSRVGGYVLSPDNTRLIEPEYTEIRAGGQPTYQPLGATVTDVATGQTLARLPAASQYAFPVDGRFIHVVGQGVFDAETGQIAVQTGAPYIRKTAEDGYGLIYEDNALGVYDLQTWTLVREISGGRFVVGEAGQWVVGAGGIYDLETGALVFALDLENMSITPSGRLLTDIARNRCAIYRLPEG